MLYDRSGIGRFIGLQRSSVRALLEHITAFKSLHNTHVKQLMIIMGTTRLDWSAARS